MRYQLLMLEALFDAAGLGYEPAGVHRLSTAGQAFPPQGILPNAPNTTAGGSAPF